MIVLFWFVFLVLSFLYTLRLEQMGDRKEKTGFILMGLGALVVIAAFTFSGSMHGVVMALAWFGLPLLLKPLAARAAASFGEGARKPRDASADLRMKRLKDGEISLDEYFKDGDRATREWKERLATLARQPAIADVLKRHRVSFRQFCILREQLALIPELEWGILGTARGVEELIELSESGKNPKDLARIYRGRASRTT
jgi:hypothetical protein